MKRKQARWQDSISDTVFLVAVRRLGGTTVGASHWLQEARAIGLTPADTEESLAWLCVDDELSSLDPETDQDRIKALKAALSAGSVR